MPNSNDSPVSPQSIEQGWALDDTRRLCEHYAKAPDFFRKNRNYGADEAWRTTYLTMRDELAMSIGRHIMALATSRGLDIPPHAEAVNSPFLSAWRRAAAGETLSGWEAISLGEPLVRATLSNLVTLRSSSNRAASPSLEDVSKIHTVIQDTVKKGEIESFEAEIPGGCQTSGTSLFLGLKRWIPFLERFDRALKTIVPLEAGDVPSPTLQQVSIPVPSGKLLVADWFSHDAFLKATEAVIDEGEYIDINYAPGRIERTRRLANALGVATVFVGDGGPNIVVEQDGVRIGHLPEEMETFCAGNINNDLWWATLIDRQVLMDLIVKTNKTTPDQAEREIQDMIETQDSPITQVSVSPGTYQLYFASDVPTFQQVFDRQADWRGVDQPMCFLSATELAPQPSRSPRRKP